MTTQEKFIEIESLRWFYREAAPASSTPLPPVVLLHGLPAQSYSWRNVLSALAEQGFHSIAPDWIGYGFSAKPDLREFAYTPEAFIKALEAFLSKLGIDRCFLVAQGFLGSVGVQYAWRHPSQVERLAIFNAPIMPEARLPWKLKQLGLPLVGDMLTQDPLLVDRTLEGGGGYRVEDVDLDVYRRPFLKSSDAGRALLATLRNLQLSQATAEIRAGASTWRQPTLVAWGMRDPWLPFSLAQTFAKLLESAEIVRLEQLEEVGHYPQQDWHEKVNAALLEFFRRSS